jgi:alpha-tubulin suppressor-like RCC1 family protein
VVITDESTIHACGFTGRQVPFDFYLRPLTLPNAHRRLGHGGRRSQHTQLSLSPIVQLASENKVTAVALGQDHTLVLTSHGVVLSWGHARFSQLGYDVPTLHVQATPRVIGGPLKRERVRGIAACKSASACWTDTALFTWGKNNGQLGYDKSASPIQPIPRIVTKVMRPVISVALNVCLTTLLVCLDF